MPKFRPKSVTGPPVGRARRAAIRSHLREEAESSPERALAERVRVCYITERSLWESRKAGRHVDYRPPAAYAGAEPLTIEGEVVVKPGRADVWLKLARWCLARDIHPETYIQVQFGLVPFTDPNTFRDPRPPEPDQLMSDRCVRLWGINKDKLAEQIRQALVIEQANAQRQFHYEREDDSREAAREAWAFVLSTVHLELSPLFRYCVACKLGGKLFRDIARQFEHEAVMQFERHRKLYETYWRTLLPSGFSDYSRQVYREILSSR